MASSNEELTQMCLAVPARIVEKKGDNAKVDFGGGTTREVNIALVNAEVGEYVIVHAGFAIEVLDEEEAKETLNLWNELLSRHAETDAKH
jgi:hydrogenase expression/formation protein HypC